LLMIVRLMVIEVTYLLSSVVLLPGPEASPEFLSLSNIVMLSLSVYVIYAGIGNINS